MSQFIPKVTKLSERVIRILGCNPGPFTLRGTNTYLVGTGRERVLIDAGEKDNREYIDLLKGVLTKYQVKLSNIIITHWHPDHIGGLLDVLGLIDSSSSCKVMKFRSETRDSARPEDLGKFGLSHKHDKISYGYLNDKQKIQVDGTTLSVYYTPGHADDHAVLLLEEEKSIFAGDCVIGEGTVTFEDLSDYLKSLDRISLLNPVKIYPGHGAEVLNPKEKINFLISRRMDRERQIIECLRVSGSKGITINEIVAIIYKDTAKELYPAAAFGINLHLQKLLKDQSIETDDLADQAHYWIKGQRTKGL